jgi:hypothetical protein
MKQNWLMLRRRFVYDSWILFFGAAPWWPVASPALTSFGGFMGSSFDSPVAFDTVCVVLVISKEEPLATTKVVMAGGSGIQSRGVALDCGLYAAHVLSTGNAVYDRNFRG